MDVRWLQDFLTVAETGNFTKAALARNASQAAFSRRIQSLEAWLGVALIDRSTFPTRLTPEGEQFRHHAGEILRQVVDARTELSGAPNPRREHVRVALPFVLATARLPHWWERWSPDGTLSCTTVLGNVHDLFSALVSGDADLLVCFHTAQQPIHLDPERYDRLAIEPERLRPYAAPSLAQALAWPGRPERPVPLLSYTPGVSFARFVDLVIETAPERLHGVTVLESDMADVLRDMAIAGRGVAFLPESTAAGGTGPLVALGGEPWSLDLQVIAFRDRANQKPAVERLWTRLVKKEVDAKPKVGERSRPRLAGAHP
ncbi:MAG TPA: LysR family transcriptional regulator [Beijerinckiaceae bacterium]|jgi:DNA-binding transcriptional LysR family regulator